MTGPSDEYWFQPWKSYLAQQGVHIETNSALTRICVEHDGKKIAQCIVRHTDPAGGASHETIKADHYVLAVDPFTVHHLVKDSPELSKDPELVKFSGLVQEGEHHNISFRIGFKESVRFPGKDTVVSIPDSPWNITLYAQEHHWDSDVDLGGDGEIKGLWSGTICVCNQPGKETGGRDALHVSREEFTKEILHQITSCREFNEMVQVANEGRDLSSFEICETEVWKEWRFERDGDGYKAHTADRKWVTTLKNSDFRPRPGTTSLTNLHLAGAHTKTSMHIWSQEGAAESGKAAARAVQLGDKGITDIPLYHHGPPSWVRAVQQVDNVLYRNGLPNVVDVVGGLAALAGLGAFAGLGAYALRTE